MNKKTAFTEDGVLQLYHCKVAWALCGCEPLQSSANGLLSLFG